MKYPNGYVGRIGCSRLMGRAVGAWVFHCLISYRYIYIPWHPMGHPMDHSNCILRDSA